MEFQLTATQVAAFNKMLPKGYKLEPSVQKEKKVKSPQEQQPIIQPKIQPPKEKIQQPNNKKVQPPINVTQNQPQQQNSNKQRRTEAELLDQESPRKIQKIEKRVTRERKPEDLGFEPKIKNVEIYKKCIKIITQLKRQQLAGPFLQPVDPEALNIPDYFTVIKEPMDLGTVEKNLKNGLYSSIHQFGADVRRIWSNSFKYNAHGSDMYHYTLEMSKIFENLYKEIENADNGKVAIEEIKKQVSQIQNQMNKMNNPVAKPTQASKVPDKPMSMQEKQNLGKNIRKLDPKFLRGVMNIVADGQPVTQKTLEFDIDNLPTRIQRELERYVKQCLSNCSKSKRSKGEVNINGIQMAHKKTEEKLKDVDQKLKSIQENKSAPQQMKEQEENQNTKEDSSSSSSDSESSSSSDEETNKQQNGFGSML